MGAICRAYPPNRVMGECVFLNETPFLMASGAKHRMGRFRCKCGNEFIAKISNVKSRTRKSCGCLPTGRILHGASHSKEYGIWASMRDRCFNPNNKNYFRYGGKGIIVCQRWNESFSNFIADMGARTTLKLSIDRVDGNKGYYCGHCDECVKNNWTANCRWATQNEQMRNVSYNRNITYNSTTLCISAWAEKLNIGKTTLFARIVRGWSTKRAFTQPVKFHKISNK